MNKISMIFSCFYIFLSSQVNAQEGLKKVDIGTNEQFNRRANRAVAAYETAGLQTNDKDIAALTNSTVVTVKPGILDKYKFGEIELKSDKKIKPVGWTPAPMIPPFFPSIGGVDPMVAAGDNYLILSQHSSFTFYDKAGNPLPAKPGGIATTWNTTNFFQDIIDIANTQSFSNLATMPGNILSTCKKATSASGTCKQLCEAYDMRVIYEPENKRFIIICALRNTVWQYNSENFPSNASAALCDKWAIRIFALAVSNTEDPRDGFKMWYWNKSNYRDWPRVSADKDIVTVAHAAAEPNTPTLYVFSLADMIAGKPSPRFFAYMAGSGNTPAAVIPVAKFRSDPPTFDSYEMYITSDGGSKAELYYFKKSADMWTKKPELKKSVIDLETELKFDWHERPVYRNGNIYFTSLVKRTEKVDNVRPASHGFILYRLPLKKSGDNVVFNKSSIDLLEYPVFPGTTTNTEFDSYEMPAISVDERGTILTAYGRMKKSSTDSIYPESRYFIFFHNETGHRTSHLLKAGEYLPRTGMPPVLDGYYHSYGSDRYIDYATVTPDPVKPFVFWIAHAYADKVAGGYKMVVGEVEAKK